MMRYDMIFIQQHTLLNPVLDYPGSQYVQDLNRLGHRHSLHLLRRGFAGK